MILCRTIPLLDVDVYLISTAEEAKTLIREKAPNSDETVVDGCVGCCHVVADAQGKNHRMLCVFDNEPNTTAHEAVHMARMILDYVSIKYTKDNDEPLAYMVGWLTAEMLKFLNQKELANG